MILSSVAAAKNRWINERLCFSMNSPCRRRYRAPLCWRRVTLRMKRVWNHIRFGSIDVTEETKDTEDEMHWFG